MLDTAALALLWLLGTVEWVPEESTWDLVSVERFIGVTASGPGDPNDGAGEPYAGGASSPRC